MLDPFSEISLNSFNSAWYWIMLGVAWSLMCHWTLGVPFDALVSAKRKGGETAAMVDSLAAITAQRTVSFFETSGVFALALGGFFIAVLGSFAFVYGYELAQAFFMMIVPLAFVHGLNVNLAFKVHRAAITGAPLQKALLRRRFWNQVIGLSSIMVTAGVALKSFVDGVAWY